jgi:ubiquinone/menaquinone biosynthesis C-methylase UbiE
MPQSPGNYGSLLKRYSAYAPVYDRRWRNYSASTLRKALENIPADGDASLLDVACGTGLLAGMLRRAHPALRITGVDISTDMLEKARQRIPPGDGVTWRVGSAENIPLPARFTLCRTHRWRSASSGACCAPAGRSCWLTGAATIR